MNRTDTDGSHVEQFIPPEGVPITFAIASIGTRFGAQFLDIVFTSIIIFICAVAIIFTGVLPTTAEAMLMEMAGPDVDVDRGIIDRLEEGQADDVVVVAVAEEQIDVADAVGEQREPGLAQAGARVEDHPMFSAANFDAGSVTAVAIELGARHGNTAADPPKFYLK